MSEIGVLPCWEGAKTRRIIMFNFFCLHFRGNDLHKLLIFTAKFLKLRRHIFPPILAIQDLQKILQIFTNPSTHMGTAGLVVRKPINYFRQIPSLR